MTTPKRPSLQIDDPLSPCQPLHPTAPTQPPSEDDMPTSSEAVHRGQARATKPSPNPGRREEPDTASRPETVQEVEPPAPQTSGQAGEALWRTWSGITGVGSFRLPHELLSELGDRARELRLPIGMIVTAAITRLLDQPPEVIAALVDRAEDARIQGRRRARRRRAEGAGE